MKVKKINLKLLFNLFLFPSVLYFGVSYALNGNDIYIYGQIDNDLFISSFKTMTSPLFNIYRIFLLKINLGQNHIAYLITGIISSFLSYFFLLTKYKKHALISWLLFLITIQGFNTSFNLIRTSFSILVISFVYWILKDKKSQILRMNISLFFGVFAHIQTILVLIIFNLKNIFRRIINFNFRQKIKMNILISIIILFFIFLFTLFFYNEKIYSYIERAINRLLQEYKVAFFYPIQLLLFTYVIKRVNKSEFQNEVFDNKFTDQWLLIGWIAWFISIMGLPLVFERISILAIFFIIPKFVIQSSVVEYIFITSLFFLRLIFI
tara:strand:- start:967 stop:1932 length:966 start_codon:yes stop_codon:yes gene_type:complete